MFRVSISPPGAVTVNLARIAVGTACSWNTACEESVLSRRERPPCSLPGALLLSGSQGSRCCQAGPAGQRPVQEGSLLAALGPPRSLPGQCAEQWGRASLHPKDTAPSVFAACCPQACGHNRARGGGSPQENIAAHELHGALGSCLGADTPLVIACLPSLL